MRPFGTLIDKTVKIREPEIPGKRLERARPPEVNRLDQGIAELFEHVCVSGDLETAGELIALWRRVLARRAHGDPAQRRADGQRLQRMVGELDRRYIMKGRRPPHPETSEPPTAGD